MTVIFMVLPLALLFSAAAVVAFLWSAQNGQLDDLDTPPLRVLMEESRSRTARSPAQRNVGEPHDAEEEHVPGRK
jgi:cbb3-type cytochrome oxidase maturation protein